MRASSLVVAAALLSCSALPVVASSCTQQISALQRRLDSFGAVQVAGLDPGHTLTTGSLKALPRALPVEPTSQQAGPTRGNVVAAKLLIGEALDADREGDQRACENILTDAKRLMGPLP
ncbi:hypothetical protein MRF4_18875 [Methylobacterium radiotolerans]|uniref:hypothetical protein n=1 Tax=Methylobacterium TaxID=407 RepID=UPI002F2CF809